MTQPKAYSYIRFSTPGQEKGSLQRQLEQAEKWAKDNGYQLDSTVKVDRGLSGYHGTHKKKGALGEFLKRVAQGDIIPGSVLLIENMDRLSREKPMTALRQFDNIIRAGIKVITLQTGMEYTEESINKNPGELYIIIGEIQRANAESERKSFLIGAARERRRKELREHKIKAFSKRLPMWIDKKSADKKSEDNAPLEHIPEVVRAINFIYDQYLDGKGKTAIMNALNDPAGNWWKPPASKTGRNKTGGWQHSTINRYLDDDRRLIGECQLYTLVDGRRVPDGDPITGIYPEVIPREKYFRVQEMKKRRSKRPGNAGGRTDQYKNLFRHLIICGLCGSPMAIHDKGDKGSIRLICTNKFKKAGCTAPNTSYRELESIVRKNFRELDISRILPGGSEIEHRIHAIRNTIDANRGKIADLEQQIENLAAKISEHDPKKQGTLDSIYHKRNKAHAAEIDKLNREIQTLSEKEITLSSQTRKLEEQFAEVNDFQDLLDQVATDGERAEIRRKLNNTLQSMIDRIVVLPLMTREQALDHYKKKLADFEAETAQKKKKELTLGEKVRFSMLRDRINTLEEAGELGIPEDEDPEPGIEYIMDSKDFDRIDLYFSGAGIIEEDEDGKARIRHRAVRLRRRELTEEFRP